MSKQLKARIKLLIPAGGATMGQPVGPALGQKGVNGMQFCNLFNDQTKSLPKGKIMAVEVLVFEKSFEIIIKGTPTTMLIKSKLGIKEAAKTPGKENLSNVLKASQLKEIIEEKMQDTNSYNFEAMKNMIIGTARSMGIGVEDV
jgi:large subunit ribosomal protein L11